MKSVAYGLIIGLILTKYDEIRCLLNLGLTNSVTELLISLVNLNSDSVIGKEIIQLMRVCIELLILVLNRENNRLYRCKP